MEIYRDALRIAATGISVVFVTIIALAFSTKIMSVLVRLLGRQKKKG